MKKILFLGCVVALFILASCKKENPDLNVKDELIGDGTFDYAGRTYTYKILGGVAWMIENLAYLPAVSPSTVESSTTPVYYVYGYEGTSVIAAKATENYKTYGVLYNIVAAKTACPPGWHLPSDHEWRYFIWINFDEDVGLEDDRWIWGYLEDYGTYVGWQLKSTTGWLEDGNGINSLGFTALPAGDRNTDYHFGYLGTGTGFWTSTTDPYNWAWIWSITSSPGWMYHVMYPGTWGFSVRCVTENWE